jgi:predicted N-acetyltransferase YhbS
VITYCTGNQLDLDEFIDVYRDCSLGARRPIEDRERMRKMLETANLVITAWDGDRMVGVSRSVTDFCYCTYLSDLAVRESHQRLGIGKELIRRTQEEGGLETRVILLAAPAAVDYYPHIGFEQHHSCWMLPPGVRLP